MCNMLTDMRMGKLLNRGYVDCGIDLTSWA